MRHLSVNIHPSRSCNLLPTRFINTFPFSLSLSSDLITQQKRAYVGESDEHQSNEASVPGAAACFVMLNLDTHSNNKLMHTDSSC
jgi:hypothetical protein